MREVGSDVPFFVKGVASKVEGIGEIVNPIEIDKDLDLLIAVPKIGLSVHCTSMFQVPKYVEMSISPTLCEKAWN